MLSKKKVLLLLAELIKELSFMDKLHKLEIMS